VKHPFAKCIICCRRSDQANRSSASSLASEVEEASDVIADVRQQSSAFHSELDTSVTSATTKLRTMHAALTALNDSIVSQQMSAAQKLVIKETFSCCICRGNCQSYCCVLATLHIYQTLCNLHIGGYLKTVKIVQNIIGYVSLCSEQYEILKESNCTAKNDI